MDMHQLMMASSAAAIATLVVAILGRLLFHKSTPRRQAAFVPLALAAGFFVGYHFLGFTFPQFAGLKLWQSPLHAAAILGVLTFLALLINFLPLSWLFTIAAIATSCLVVLGSIKFNPPPTTTGYLLYGLCTIGGSLLLWVVLQPLATRDKSNLLVPFVLLLSSAALTYIVLYAIDATLGKLLGVATALIAASCVLAVIPPLGHLVRGVPVFCATLLVLFCALAALYNVSPVKTYVFMLPAVAPLAAAIGYLPFLGKRWWFSLPLAILGTGTLLALAIWITRDVAPPLV